MTPAPTMTPVPTPLPGSGLGGLPEQGVRWLGDHCGGCAPGWFGPACESQCPSTNIAPCSGNGACDDGLTVCTPSQPHPNGVK